MAKLFGMDVTRKDLMKRVGDVSQIADARECTLTSGKAEGVRAIEVKTGSGLEFTVLPSRALDISWAAYQGKPISFISKSGVVRPDVYEKDGLSFLRNFTCGMVTTCGLTYMGAPCEDQGEALGLHGRISNIPAQDVSVYKEWIDDDFVIKIRGKVSESSIFGENLVLTREIETHLGDKSFKVHDVVENLGFDKTPFMLLYHVNFGYPIVSENSRLVMSCDTKVEARDEEAQKGLEKYDTFEAPQHGYQEQVFFHTVNTQDSEVCAAIFNDELKYGGYIKYNTKEFTHLGEWKLMGEGDYVVGIEPGNWYPLGRAEARKRNELKYLEPGEKAEFHYEIGVLESEEDLKRV